MGSKDELYNAVVNLEEDKSYNLVKKMVEEKEDPNNIIEILKEAVDVIFQ